MIQTCILLIFVGIFLLIAGVGSSIKLKLAGLIIPGSIGMMLIAIGVFLILIGRC